MALLYLGEEKVAGVCIRRLARSGQGLGDRAEVQGKYAYLLPSMPARSPPRPARGVPLLHDCADAPVTPGSFRRVSVNESVNANANGRVGGGHGCASAGRYVLDPSPWIVWNASGVQSVLP